VSAPAPQAGTKRDAAAPSWVDGAGFAAGLLLAWWQGWKTTDLVWSLWLSSLVVGYAMIVWTLLGPVARAAPHVWRERAAIPAVTGKSMVGIAVVAAGGLFMLAFFTVHFGGFHFGHSVFLHTFFPITANSGHPGWATYAEVWSRYWLWLPLAFVAERGAFTLRAVEETAPPDTAVTPEAIARRKARPAAHSSMMAPYKNVIRMHLLIFFFAGAHFAKLENFAVYAVVYAVYFFPWRWARGRFRAQADAGAARS
jgi:Family of unknown function (DUF6498)